MASDWIYTVFYDETLKSVSFSGTSSPSPPEKKEGRSDAMLRNAADLRQKCSMTLHGINLENKYLKKSVIDRNSRIKKTFINKSNI